jgi:hypothetical protein
MRTSRSAFWPLTLPCLLGAFCLPTRADLSGEEQGIVDLLRGPLPAVDLVSYDAKLTIAGQQGADDLVIDAHCRITPESAEVTIRDVSGPGRPYGFVLQPGLTYRLLDGTAEISYGEQVAARFTRDSGQDLVPDHLKSLPAIGPLLLSAGHATDPAAFSWQRVEDERDGVHVYEAQAIEPPAGAGPHPAVRYRFWRDAEKGCVTRVVGFAADDSVVTETRYERLAEVEAGKTVALRAVTKRAAGSDVYRVKVGDQLTDTGVPRPAQVIVTSYEWLADERVRLPVRREVGDAAGEPLCLMEFSNHQVLPTP